MIIIGSLKWNFMLDEYKNNLFSGNSIFLEMVLITMKRIKSGLNHKKLIVSQIFIFSIFKVSERRHKLKFVIGSQ